MASSTEHVISPFLRDKIPISKDRQNNICQRTKKWVIGSE